MPVGKIRSARHYQPKTAPIRVLVDHGKSLIRRDIHGALSHLGDSMDIDRANYLARNGRWREIGDTINYGHFNEVLKAPFNRLGTLSADAAQIGVRSINGAFNRAGARVQFAVPHIVRKDTSAVARQFNYDRFAPATLAMLRAYQDKFILGLSAESRATIAAVIIHGQRMGLPPEAIVDDIKMTIGLTPRQAQAVMNYRNMLTQLDPEALSRRLAEGDDTDKLQAAIDAGKPLAAALVDEMTARYEDNYLDYRAGVIAQTEATRAASVGLQDSYQQMVDRGIVPEIAVRRFWQIDMDEKTCPLCISIADMNEDGVGLNQPFDSIAGPVNLPVEDTHVGCRCGIEYHTDLDMLAAA